MRVTSATFSGHGAALLAAAGRLFRARGLERVSVADISRDAGLTHGAFYGHFASKEALAAASCRDSLWHSAQRWRARAASAPDDPLGAIIDGYLTEQHRDEPAQDGCALSALGAEASRAGEAVAAGLAEGTGALLDVLQNEIAHGWPALSAGARNRLASGLLATLAGGLLVARALRPYPEKSRAALAAAQHAGRQLIRGVTDVGS